MTVRILIVYGVAVVTAVFLIAGLGAVVNAYESAGWPGAVAALVFISGVVAVLLGVLWGEP